MVGQVLRRRWRALLILVVVGAGVGAGASAVLSPGYETTASVLLQGPRQADELLTQAQVATSSVVLDRAAAALGMRESGPDLQKKVTASVAQGNVVAITASSDSPEHAQQLADQVAKEFVKYSTQLLSNSAGSSAQLAQEQREALRQQVAQTNQRILDLSRSVTDGQTVEGVQVRTELQGLRTSIEQAMNNLDAADAATGAGNMVVMGPSEKPTSQAPPTLPQLAGGGAILFFLIGLLSYLFGARSDRRPRSETEIGSALGAPVLASVDVPETGERESVGGFRGVLRRITGSDKPWNLPEVPASADASSREVRYRRVFARLGTDRDGVLRLLVLVAAGDSAARRAAAQFAKVAETERVRVELTTTEVTVGSDVQPTVPDGTAGVLVVLSVGSRSAWELVTIAEACADAGHEVLGAVLTRQVRVTGKPRREPASADPPQVPVDRDVMAGSS
ncbi:exopolysaccharide biosynthesis protein [Amycolatopsis carbonis]|uniref:Exopolysaccharide biosynthesis protein n=1 Tax=Amycolatopsis carbonis TaxID=715471 RepID=A0A9Y2IIK6_9PSEU|nr:exopolysaccharide biosynthesis protein [Amycolatopsis sp. 2-15]WIX80089.1 exopolysaccharide biosynthesis protein [Amycolatopsis sp. 2-15]